MHIDVHARHELRIAPNRLSEALLDTRTRFENKQSSIVSHVCLFLTPKCTVFSHPVPALTGAHSHRSSGPHHENSFLKKKCVNVVFFRPQPSVAELCWWAGPERCTCVWAFFGINTVELCSSLCYKRVMQAALTETWCTTGGPRGSALRRMLNSVLSMEY